MIQNRFHFKMAFLMALLLHGGLIFGYRLPPEKVLSLPPPPLRLSLQLPVLETEVVSEPAPVTPEPSPQKVSPSPPLEREVLPEASPEPLPVISHPPLQTVPDPPVIVAEIPEPLPEIEVIPEEVIPEVPTQELPIVSPEPLPEPEVVEVADFPEPRMEVEPEPEVMLPEVNEESIPEPPVILAEMPSPEVPEVLPEPEILPQESMPEPVAEPLLAQVTPDPVAELLNPEVETTEVSTNWDVSPQSAETAAAYQKQLTAWLEKHKYYPRRARRLRIEGEGWLRIRIDRAGRAQEIQLERTTGNRLLDRAALEIARRADPFPALPQSDSRQELEFIVPVSFMLR